MENFFNYITQSLQTEEVEIWFKSQNIFPEKLELFFDFLQSLNLIISETYLGESDSNSETKIVMTEDDKHKHFVWCWNKVIDDFSKEELIFEKTGEHFDYLKSFYDDIFYLQKEEIVRKSISKFFKELFDLEKPFTKSDLDMIGNIYKLLDKNMKIKKK
jgi:hypothetical protein